MTRPEPDDQQASEALDAWLEAGQPEARSLPSARAEQMRTVREALRSGAAGDEELDDLVARTMARFDAAGASDAAPPARVPRPRRRRPVPAALAAAAAVLVVVAGVALLSRTASDGGEESADSAVATAEADSGGDGTTTAPSAEMPTSSTVPFSNDAETGSGEAPSLEAESAPTDDALPEAGAPHGALPDEPDREADGDLAAGSEERSPFAGLRMSVVVDLQGGRSG